MALDRPARVLVAVWAALVLATVASFWLGHEHTGDGAVLGVLAITFVKVWAVGRQFMELRGAPLGLRGLFDGYCVVVPVALAVLWLAG